MQTFNAEHIKIDHRQDGCFSFVTRDEKLLNEVKAHFRRTDKPNLLVKIFHMPLTDFYASYPRRFMWGKYFDFHEISYNAHGLALDACAVQNLYAFIGKAPRVYAYFLVKSPYGTTHLATLQDDAGEREHENVNAEVYESLRHNKYAGWDLVLPFNDEWTRGNVAGGLWIDWQGAGFGENYLAGLQQRYLYKTGFGLSKYQTAPEINVFDGIRDTYTRLQELGIDYMAFSGKTVIDIGCSGGQLLNACIDRGAVYAVGLDWADVIDGAREVSNYTCRFNIDYDSCDLNKPLPDWVMKKAPFDIILFTSMITHVGVPKYLHKLGHFMVLEINHDNQVQDTLKKLEPFWDCKFIGRASDHGDRSIYHCINKAIALSTQ